MFEPLLYVVYIIKIAILQHIDTTAYYTHIFKFAAAVKKYDKTTIMN